MISTRKGRDKHFGIENRWSSYGIFSQHGEGGDRLQLALFAHFTFSRDRWIVSDYTSISPLWRNSGIAMSEHFFFVEHKI